MWRTPWQYASDYYAELKQELYANADLRSKDMLFMRSLDGMILLTIGYVVFTVMGPRLMENYKALDLKWPMFIYNVAMAIFALWMFFEMLISTWQAGYNYVCDNYNEHTSFEPRDLRVVHAMWWYFVSKPIEFVDTAFMVLKKKNSQITVLHVWHHAFMFPFLFLATLLGPGGLALVAPIINCFIHAVMYTYYGLSLFPTLHPYLGWKRYLTQMQLAQFFIIIVNATHGIWIDCNYPYYLKYTEVIFISSLVVLFGNFYFQAYLKRKHGRSIQKIPSNGAIKKEKSL